MPCGTVVLCCPEWGKTFRKESYKGGYAAGNSRRGRRKSTRSVPSRQGHRRKAKKGFNWIVRSCCLGALIRGLQNLKAPCEGERIVTFCIVQKVTKKHARTCKKLPVASFCASETAETGRIANGREQSDHVSRRRLRPATSIQIAGRTVIAAKMTGFHQVTG